MNIRWTAIALCAALVSFICGTTLMSAAQDPGMATQMVDHKMVSAGEIEWGPAPPSLPAGAKAAILTGDPRVEGVFTLRISLPPNYSIAPHRHPADEHVTVISGSFSMALGDKVDRSFGRALKVGDFAQMKKGTVHYAWTGSEGAVVQLHGVGPWDIIYVNPADDPRKQ